MAESSFEWLRVAAFALLLLPVLAENLTSGRITNAHNALIFLAGAVLLVAERLLVDSSAGLPWAFWIAAFLLVMVAAFMGAVPGGVAKFLIALLPWFTGWEAYVVTATAGFFLTAAWGYAKGSQAPLVPSFHVAGLGALIYAAA